MKKIIIILLFATIACQTLIVRQHDITYSHIVGNTEVVQTESFVSYSIDRDAGIIRGRSTNHMNVEIYLEGLKIISIRHYGIAK